MSRTVVVVLKQETTKHTNKNHFSLWVALLENINLTLWVSHLYIVNHFFSTDFICKPFFQKKKQILYAERGWKQKLIDWFSMWLITNCDYVMGCGQLWSDPPILTMLAAIWIKSTVIFKPTTMFLIVSSTFVGPKHSICETNFSPSSLLFFTPFWELSNLVSSFIFINDYLVFAFQHTKEIYVWVQS